MTHLDALLFNRNSKSNRSKPISRKTNQSAHLTMERSYLMRIDPCWHYWDIGLRLIVTFDCQLKKCESNFHCRFFRKINNTWPWYRIVSVHSCRSIWNTHTRAHNKWEKNTFHQTKRPLNTRKITFWRHSDAF